MLQAAEEGHIAAAGAPSKAAEKRARKKAAARAAAAAATAPAPTPAPGLSEHAQPSGDAASDSGAAGAVDTAVRMQHMSLASGAAVQPESTPQSTARQGTSATAETQVQQQPHLPLRQQPPSWMLCPITKVRDTMPERVLLSDVLNVLQQLSCPGKA